MKNSRRRYRLKVPGTILMLCAQKHDSDLATCSVTVWQVLLPANNNFNIQRGIMPLAAPHSWRPSLAEIRASDWLASLEKLNRIAVCRPTAGGLPQVGLTATGSSCATGNGGRIEIPEVLDVFSARGSRHVLYYRQKQIFHTYRNAHRCFGNYGDSRGYV